MGSCLSKGKKGDGLEVYENNDKFKPRKKPSTVSNGAPVVLISAIKDPNKSANSLAPPENPDEIQVSLKTHF